MKRAGRFIANYSLPCLGLRALSIIPERLWWTGALLSDPAEVESNLNQALNEKGTVKRVGSFIASDALSFIGLCALPLFVERLFWRAFAPLARVMGRRLYHAGKPGGKHETRGGRTAHNALSFLVS